MKINRLASVVAFGACLSLSGTSFAAGMGGGHMGGDMHMGGMGGGGYMGGGGHPNGAAVGGGGLSVVLEGGVSPVTAEAEIRGGVRRSGLAPALRLRARCRL